MSLSLASAPLAYWAVLAGVFGLAMGSFFTVAAYRWPREESLVTPRSHCTGCERTLHWYELVPVLSWVLQRGHCRGCGSGISWRYPAIELVSGALASTAILTFGPTLKGLAAMILVLTLVPVVVIDLEHKLIPDIIVLPAAAAALALVIAEQPDRWWVPITGALGASLFLLILALVYPGGMGLGDVKLALLLGAVLGASVVPALAVAFFAGALMGAVFLVRVGKAARKMAIPFGPFLAAGALVALWFGPSMIDWYSGQF